MDVTVVIATFGEDKWMRLAMERAVPSVPPEVKTILSHHPSDLAVARNTGLEEVKTEWVVFLDADDELDDGYFDAMELGHADVRGPMARYVEDDGSERLWQPRVAGHEHNCVSSCLRYGNWLLIGSAVRSQSLCDVGGFRNFEWSEDWDLWIRCWKYGMTFELIHDAIYIAHVSPDSRNRGSATRDAQLLSYNAIRRVNNLEQH